MSDTYDETYLDRTYGGAPDECSICYREGRIVKLSDCIDQNH